METQKEQVIYANIDFCELPEVRECRIIKQLTGKLRPKDKCYLATINPPLEPLPECGINQSISEIALSLVDKNQDLDAIKREFVPATVVYPGYSKNGRLDEEKSVKLGYANLYSDFDSAKEKAATYGEMIWQFREGNCLDIKMEFDGEPELRQCKIVRELETDAKSKDKFYLAEITPPFISDKSSEIPNLKTEAVLAFISNKYDLVAVKDGEVTGEVLYSKNVHGKMFDSRQCIGLGTCIVYFKF